jgi:hypothetical protein
MKSKKLELQYRFRNRIAHITLMLSALLEYVKSSQVEAMCKKVKENKISSFDLGLSE